MDYSILLKKMHELVSGKNSLQVIIGYVSERYQFLQVVLHKKWSFPFRISSVNVAKSAVSDLVTFTEEVYIGKLHILCSVENKQSYVFWSPTEFLKAVFPVLSYSIWMFWHEGTCIKDLFAVPGGISQHYLITVNEFDTCLRQENVDLVLIKSWSINTKIILNSIDRH